MKPDHPLSAGRIAGKLSTALMAGEIDFGDVRWLAIDMSHDAPLTGNDLDWIVERVRQTRKETEGQ